MGEKSCMWSKFDGVGFSTTRHKGKAKGSIRKGSLGLAGRRRPRGSARYYEILRPSIPHIFPYKFAPGIRHTIIYMYAHCLCMMILPLKVELHFRISINFLFTLNIIIRIYVFCLHYCISCVNSCWKENINCGFF